MRKDEKSYHILVIEDNLGDNILIEEYLSENILNPVLSRAETFQSAKALLQDRSNTFDIIFLDLSLPDLSGEPLIVGILELAIGTPVVALTGFSDLEFSIKSLALGVSDYLLKDELTAIILYKSVIYAIQRRKFTDQIQKSEKRYSDLFQLSPLPMWVYDLETLQFLNINQAAISHYGYSEDEFLSMSILQIRPEEDVDLALKTINNSRQGIKLNPQSVFRHKKKNGELIFVEVTTNLLNFNGRDVETIEKQNQTFREIAWIQSHVIRAPLARLLGLVNLLESEVSMTTGETMEVINHIKDSAEELDQIVRDISKKSEQIEPLDKNER
jgi:PAS domain S-box-containing protein